MVTGIDDESGSSSLMPAPTGDVNDWQVLPSHRVDGSFGRFRVRWMEWIISDGDVE
jgi:hypothetical protein